MTGLCIVLCVVIVVQGIAHAIERRDLYSRIQSRDFKEYTAMSGERRKPAASPHDKVLSRWRHQNINRGDRD